VCLFYLEKDSEVSQIKISIEDILGKISKINNYSVTRTRWYSLILRRKKVLCVLSGRRSKSIKHVFILIFCPKSFQYI